MIDARDLSKEIEKEFISGINFPYEIFPQAIQDLIINAEETIRLNADCFSAGILSACATATGSSVRIHNGSWGDNAILWLAIVGKSGTGKTHPLELAIKIIEKRDKKNHEEFLSQLQNFEEQENRGTKPKYVKTILRDYTPEKLGETLSHNKNGVQIFKDEMIGWIKSFNQYSAGADQQMYLQLWNGGVFTVDRVSKAPIRVDDTNVNVLGGIQQTRLKELASNGRADDGFLSRMLFVFPTNVKPVDFTGNKIEDKHLNNYENLINNLFDVTPKTLKVNTEQIKIFQDWQHRTVKENFDDDVERLIQAKLQTYVWRFALILEMMEQASTNSNSDIISNKSLVDAIRLAEYFRANALKVADVIFNDSPLQNLPFKKLELYKALPIEFKRSEVLQLFTDFGVTGGTMSRFLRDKNLFLKIDSKGNYKRKHT